MSDAKRASAVETSPPTREDFDAARDVTLGCLDVVHRVWRIADRLYFWEHPAHPGPDKYMDALSPVLNNLAILIEAFDRSWYAVCDSLGVSAGRRRGHLLTCFGRPTVTAHEVAGMVADSVLDIRLSLDELRNADHSTKTFWGKGVHTTLLRTLAYCDEGYEQFDVPGELSRAHALIDLERHWAIADLEGEVVEPPPVDDSVADDCQPARFFLGEHDIQPDTLLAAHNRPTSPFRGEKRGRNMFYSERAVRRQWPDMFLPPKPPPP